jgi:hypothetical protein
MNNKQRLMLISKVAKSLNEDLWDVNTSHQMMLDKAWVIGMLSDHTLSEEELKEEVEQVKKTHPEFTDLLRVLKKGDKYIFTDVLGFKQVFIYDGVRREVKGCEFEFFVDDKGGGCFFTDAEVDKMEKVIVDDEKDWQVDVMIENVREN